jgi:hypothetical protein
MIDLCTAISGTYLLSYLCNQHRMEKIGLVDQFIMAYGGLRGAICYGLAMTLDKVNVLIKDKLNLDERLGPCASQRHVCVDDCCRYLCYRLYTGIKI